MSIHIEFELKSQVKDILKVQIHLSLSLSLSLSLYIYIYIYKYSNDVYACMQNGMGNWFYR